MHITTFDLYGNEKSNNHGVNTYNDVFFDGKNLKYSSKTLKNVSKYELSNILNKSDYKISHNFYGYDSLKLPSLENHHSNNIDTLLIDCLISFNETHHNLKKSIDNTPLEDAKTTYEILEKNIIKFHNFPEDIKQLLFSLLVNYEEYNDFFIFYNKLSVKKLTILDSSEIINKTVTLLGNKNILNLNSLDIINTYLGENDKSNKLSIAYLIMFIHTSTLVLPDFIFNSNKNLNIKLRELLNKFYSYISKDFNKNINTYLKQLTGYNDFTGETQTQGIQNTLENKDFLTILSTGGGKSLIYQLPAWLIGKELGHLTLVITPLKALIKDQIDGLRDREFNEVNYLSGDQNGIEKEVIYNKINKILFLTPEALRSEKILKLLQNRYISRVIVDEAHTLILWGQEFRPDYFFIKYFIEEIEKVNLNNKINITLLTATATVDVERGILEYFNDREVKLIKAKEILKANIIGSVINIENIENKMEILLNKIIEIDISNNPTIIFTGRRKTAEDIEKYLKDKGINIKYFHAGMYTHDKKQVQEDFIKGNLNLIVATKAFGMGIDKSNVRYVIHYDLPGNIEDYTQEIGRAGRDGINSQNIIFYDKKDIEDRIKKIRGLNYYNIQNFLKYVNIKEKIVLSPRQIAIYSGIKTNKLNWITDIKILLSFLENESFDGKNILKRKFDNTYVLFNKIENNILNDSNKLIEKDSGLSNDEKTLAKGIIYKIVEQKEAIDLNNLEENFKYELGEDFNFKKVKINKITNIIKSLKILSKGIESEKTDIVIIANIIKDENYRSSIFNIYLNRIIKIDNFLELNENNNFYENIKNYYLFKNYINEKKGKIIVKNKELLLNHFKTSSEVGKIILKYLYHEENSYKEKQIISLDKLLFSIQNTYKSNYTISELKEVLFFLDRLNIIKVKNGLLVFLSRYSLFFDDSIVKNIDNFKSHIITEQFKSELINRLEIFKNVKINKLLAIQNIVEILESRGISEYTKLTEYYFKTPLKEFAKEHLEKKTILN